MDDGRQDGRVVEVGKVGLGEHGTVVILSGVGEEKADLAADAERTDADVGDLVQGDVGQALRGS